MALTVLPVLLLITCATGVALVLWGRRAPLTRHINNRIQEIKGESLDDAIAKPRLHGRVRAWDRILFGEIKQEICLVEGTIGSTHVLAFAFVVVIGSCVAYWFGDWMWAAAALVTGLVAGRRAITYVANRHRKQFLDHFPTYLDRIRKLVEAGNSLDVALRKGLAYANPRVVRSIAPALRRHDLGMPVATALDIQAKKLGISEISQLALVAYVISRYGGSLSDSMAHIAQVERDRARANREMEALTAEVRTSAKVFISLPILVGMGILVIHPSYVQFFIEDRTGPAILACCVLSLAIGLAIMRRMSRID